MAMAVIRLLSCCLLWHLIHDIVLSQDCETDQFPRPQEGVSLVGSDGRIYCNNSLVDGNVVFTPPSGLRCFSASNSVYQAEWINPSGDVITNVDKTMETLFVYLDVTMCGFVNLVRNRRIQSTGIFTCRISDEHNVTQTLFIGVYLSSQYPILAVSVLLVEPVDGSNTSVTFNCSSIGSPATSVLWYRNGELIVENGNHTMEQIVRNTETAAYDNLLQVSVSVIEDGEYQCIVNNSLLQDSATIRIFVFQPPVNVSYNTTTRRVSWNSTRGLEDPFSALIVSDYNLVVTGGQCILGELILNLSDSEKECDCVVLSDHSVAIENGANYTLILRSVDNVSISVPLYFSTPALDLVPGEPKSFTFRVMGSSSIVLSWEEVECLQRNGMITGYQLHREDDGTIVLTNASRCSVTVSGLNPFSTYSFKVAAVSDAGVGPFIQIEARIFTVGEIVGIGLGVAAAVILFITGCLVLTIYLITRCSHRTTIKGDPPSAHEGSSVPSEMVLSLTNKYSGDLEKSHDVQEGNTFNESNLTTREASSSNNDVRGAENSIAKENETREPQDQTLATEKIIPLSGATLKRQSTIRSENESVFEPIMLNTV